MIKNFGGGGCRFRFFNSEACEPIAKTKRFLFIVGIWCVVVVLVDNLHNEWNKSGYEDLVTLSKVAPFFE